MIARYVRSRRDFLRATLPRGTTGLFVAGAILAHGVAAWCNAGFLSADEHYQIIEFAQYKLGVQPASALAWEFAAHMRPALQPFLAALLIRVARAWGMTSPFAIAFALRLVSAALALVASLELCVRTLPHIDTRWARRAGLVAAWLLWIVPTVHARFASENWSGLWLAAGLCLAIDAVEAPLPSGRALWRAVLAGVAFSVAFECRFQIAFAIAGAGLWFVARRRAPVSLLVAAAASFVAGCGAAAVLDHWLYGAWTFPPLPYLQLNLIEGRAAAYGTGPWWIVATYAAVVLIPPYSLAVLALLVVGSWRARRDLIVWTALPFVAVHVVVARKDARFLIPLLYLLGPWIAVCVDRLPSAFVARLSRWRHTAAGRLTLASFAAVNVVALVVAIVLPGNDTIALDRWLWHTPAHTVVYAFGPRDTGLPPNVTDSFYRSDVVMRPLTSAERLQGSAPAYVYYRGAMPPSLAAHGCVPVLRAYPGWLADRAVFRRLTNVSPEAICRLAGEHAVRPPAD